LSFQTRSQAAVLHGANQHFPLGVNDVHGRLGGHRFAAFVSRLARSYLVNLLHVELRLAVIVVQPVSFLFDVRQLRIAETEQVRVVEHGINGSLVADIKLIERLGA
jgi:hypothetical protein